MYEKEFAARVNEAISNSCATGDFQGKEHCVFIPVPKNVGFDPGKVVGIHFDHPSITKMCKQDVEGESWIDVWNEWEALDLDVYKVTGTVK